MREMIIYTVVLTAAVALASFVLHGVGDKRAVRLALGAILLCGLAMPLRALFDADAPGLPELGLQESGTLPDTHAILESAYRDGIRRAICNKWDLEYDDVSAVVIGFDASRATCDKLTVTLTGSGATADKRAIENWILRECGIKQCEVGYGYDDF